MNNSRMVLIVSSALGGRSYVQELLDKIVDNVEVVIADEMPVQEEKMHQKFYVGDPPDWYLNEMNQAYALSLPVKDDTFRGGSRGKGGKTKYRRG